jgi:tRNA pseudouridine38-40 synthase
MAYDGTRYCGWQIQPGRITVQQVLQDALATLLKTAITVTGAGRTDTGVHASSFVAHFDADDVPGHSASPSPDPPSPVHPDPPSPVHPDPPSPVHPDLLRTAEIPDPAIPPDPAQENFIFRLNRFLPPDIVVYRIVQVAPDLHARFSATWRTYHYRISSVKPLYNRDYTHYVFGKLDVEEITRCCRLILETSDFTSFSKLHTDVATNNCKVTLAEWKTLDTGYLFEIKADRFLRNMVRSLVGTLLQAGLGKITAEDFGEIIRARDRRKAGMSAPAKGLFLMDIGYGDADPFMPPPAPVP